MNSSDLFFYLLFEGQTTHFLKKRREVMQEKIHSWDKATTNSPRESRELRNSPAEHTKNQVHDKECAKYNHGDEIDELPRTPHGILDLLLTINWFY